MPSSSSRNKHDYPDDIFADTRMTFGEHLAELQFRMIRAIFGLAICLFIGFILDAIGTSINKKDPPIGLGWIVMNDWIQKPVEDQVRDFYRRRNDELTQTTKLDTKDVPSPERVAELNAKVEKYGYSGLSAEEKTELRAAPVRMPMVIDAAAFAPVFGPPKDGAAKEIRTEVMMFPTHVSFLASKGEVLLESRKYLTVLSIQEGVVVYFKVTLLCGVVLSSPWLFWQAWAFVGAGLYPHEKKHVYTYLPFSLSLFLAGVFLCQFYVLPGAIKALLSFSEWLNLDPDIRLNEWLGFAIILPLVFGLSFQTPLVMLFLNRLGVFTATDYLTYWRYAFMALAVFAAVLTPTPDPATMLYLFVPMFGLYMLGIAIVYFFPASHELLEQETSEEVAV